MAKRTLVAEKICVDCNKSYAPTSNVQKRCDDCREKHKKNYKAPVKKTKKKSLSSISKKHDVKVRTGVKEGDLVDALVDQYHKSFRTTVELFKVLKTIGTYTKASIPELETTING